MRLAVKQTIKDKARQLGFVTVNLIWPRWLMILAKDLKDRIKTKSRQLGFVLVNSIWLRLSIWL